MNSVESVEIQDVDGKVSSYPDMSERTQTAKLDYIKQAIGVDIPTDEIVGLLNRISSPFLFLSLLFDVIYACPFLQR